MHILIVLTIGVFIPNKSVKAQDCLGLPINYQSDTIFNANLLRQFNAYFSKCNDSTPFRMLYVGDSHVKSGYLAESLVQLLNESYKICAASKGIIIKDSISRISLKVLARNGATAQSVYDEFYNDSVVKLFNPHMIIISLGTNEAYSGTPKLSISTSYLQLLNALRNDAPLSDVLITVPGEVYKKNISKIRITSKKSKKKRYKTVVSYVSWDYQHEVHSLIKEIHNSELVALWDFYTVMGGKESIKKWAQAGYANSDMVHYTKEGYRLQAYLLHNALIETIHNTNQ